jgi:hypothetical protein
MIEQRTENKEQRTENTRTTEPRAVWANCGLIQKFDAKHRPDQVEVYTDFAYSRAEPESLTRTKNKE